MTWTVEGAIKAGKKDQFLVIMEQLIAAAKKEAGTIMYEWTLSEDESSVHIYERYRNEDAAKAHLAQWETNGPLFLDVVDITKITVFSALNDNFKAAFTGPATVFMNPVGGFVK
nr:antibiotic biosynthesis monooxygenase [Pseudoalteromonas fuliginea]